ncbi:sister chromatid cohesion protein [Pseudoscourfieldia marina]
MPLRRSARGVGGAGVSGGVSGDVSVGAPSSKKARRLASSSVPATLAADVATLAADVATRAADVAVVRQLAALVASTLAPGARITQNEARRVIDKVVALVPEHVKSQLGDDVSLLADAVAEKLEHEHGVLLTKASDIHGDGGASVTPSLATDAGLENAAALLEVGEDAKLALAVALARQPVTQEIVQAAVRAVHASLKAAAAAADGDDDDDACAALRSCTAVGTLGAHATGRRSFGLLNAVNAAARGAANVRLQALVGSSEMRSAEKDAESDAALARACALATVRASAARHGDAKEAAAVAIFHRCLHRLHRQHAAPGIRATGAGLRALAQARLRAVLSGDERATAATRVDIADALGHDAMPILSTLGSLARAVDDSDADSTLARRLAVRVYGRSTFDTLPQDVAKAVRMATATAWILCFAAALRQGVQCTRGSSWFTAMEASVRARAMVAAAGGGVGEQEAAAGIARAAVMPTESVVNWLSEQAKRGKKKKAAPFMARLASIVSAGGGIADTPEVWAALMLPLDEVKEGITDVEAADLLELGALYEMQRRQREEEEEEEEEEDDDGGDDDEDMEDSEEDEEDEEDGGVDVAALEQAVSGALQQVAGDVAADDEEEEDDDDEEEDDDDIEVDDRRMGSVDDMLAALEKGL